MKRYVIGDLPKQDAQLFWEGLLKREDISHPLPDFETVYSICKGNMFLTEKALEYWCLESLGWQRVLWGRFPNIVQEESKLIRAYYRNDGLALRNKSPPLWDQEHLMMIMKELVKSNGFVIYSKLCH